MSSGSEYWSVMGPAMKEERQERGRQNRYQADEDFDLAAEDADRFGFRLVKLSAQHYQLWGPDPNPWLINLYPGNGRVYGDRNHPRAPYLRMQMPWRLFDAVKAAARTKKRPQSASPETAVIPAVRQRQQDSMRRK